MRREPIFRSAVLVVSTWIGIWCLLHRDSAWQIIKSGIDGIAAVAILAVAGAAAGWLASLWLSSQVHDDRISALRPRQKRGIVATIGILPVHGREPDALREGFDAANAEKSLRDAIGRIRASRDLLPARQRRGSDNGDGVDLDAIEQRILSQPQPYVALFDAVLRVLLHRPELLTTYESEGHGRHNGHGGSTLLQHSLLVCQKALDIAPHWSYEGMRTVNKDGTPGEIAYPPRKRAKAGFADDPLVPIIGLAHDIGKIQCYQWRPGAAEPYALAPNHDMVSARMLAVMPQTWGLPAAPEGDADDDLMVLLTAVAHYHHPPEQPMDSAGLQGAAAVTGRNRILLDLGGVKIRSDRQVALMELLIAADTAAGAIESRDVPRAPADALGVEAASAVRGSPGARGATDVNAAIWDAIESILLEHGRVNATYSRGSVSSASVGTLHHLPDWGGPVLILKEDDFVRAIVGRADIPGDLRDALIDEDNDGMARGNTVRRATTLVLRALDSRNMLLTPPGQAAHSAETALWKISFYNPNQVYRGGDVTQDRLPTPDGSQKFAWGSAIVCAPAQALPNVAAMTSYPHVPVCTGSRMGRQGDKSRKQSRRSVLDDDTQVPQSLPDDRPAVAVPIAAGSSADTFISILEAGLRQGDLQAQFDLDGNLVIQASFETIIANNGLREHAPTIAQSILESDGARVSLQTRADTDGHDYRAILVDSDWWRSLAPVQAQAGVAEADQTVSMVGEGGAVESDGQGGDDLAQAVGDSVDMDAQQSGTGEPDAPAGVPEDVPNVQVDGFVVFQQALAAYLAKAGPGALAPKRDRATNKAIDYVVRDPVDELFQKLGTEEALVELPEGPDAEFSIVETGGDQRVRRLRVSPSWLERRDLLPPA